MDGYKRRHGLFFPILLVGLGVFLLLINIGSISGTAYENLLTYWPILLILAGLDGLWRGDGIVWSLVLAGLGVLLLLGNLGVLSVRALPLLARIWPILLVAIGIDIAFGRNHSGWLAGIRAGLGLLLVAIIFWLAVAFPTGLGSQKVNFEQNIDGAKSSQINLSTVTGKISLKGGAASGKLITGDAVLLRNTLLKPVYDKPVNGESRFNLKVEGSRSFVGDNFAEQYDLAIASSLPIKLETALVVGNLAENLTGTAVNGVNTDLVIGSQAIYLPCNHNLAVNLKQVIGVMTLYLPQGCNVNIKLEDALVNTSLPAGFQRTGNLVINPAANNNTGPVNISINMVMGAVGISETK